MNAMAKVLGLACLLVGSNVYAENVLRGDASLQDKKVVAEAQKSVHEKAEKPAKAVEAGKPEEKEQAEHHHRHHHRHHHHHHAEYYYDHEYVINKHAFRRIMGNH